LPIESVEVSYLESPFLVIASFSRSPGERGFRFILIIWVDPAVVVLARVPVQVPEVVHVFSLVLAVAVPVVRDDNPSPSSYQMLLLKLLLKVF